MVSVNHVLTFLPQSFFKISNDSEVVDAVEKALQSFEDVDYNTLLKGGRKQASLSPVQQLSSFMWIVWIIVGVIVLIVIAVVFFVWHFRRQLFSLSSQMARQRVFGGHEMASFNRIRQRHEGIYEYPSAYAFWNQYREGCSLLQAI